VNVEATTYLQVAHSL